ncbi:hypothetical protein ANN_24187 [Periplaneta americana]|uniref:Uncharacterized protein n=1 Tax=Periplaneta americana TaxID=6978 RepID=A0ABQ8S2F5_PERAM|nr:hypothetical protein ANN_24187 [Periplaneta americana]
MKTRVQIPVPERIILCSTHPPSYDDVEFLYGNIICTSYLHGVIDILLLKCSISEELGYVVSVKCVDSLMTGMVDENGQVMADLIYSESMAPAV